MPIYVYKCKKCKYTQEEIQKVSELDKVKIYCDNCHEEIFRVPAETNFALIGRWFKNNGSY